MILDFVLKLMIWLGIIIVILWTADLLLRRYESKKKQKESDRRSHD